MTYRVIQLASAACDTGCCLVGWDRELNQESPHMVWRRPMFQVLTDDEWGECDGPDHCECGPDDRFMRARAGDYRVAPANAERTARWFIRRLRAAGV